MFKRIVAMFLCLVTITGLSCSLAGCGNNNNVITKGEVLSLVIDAFGMNESASNGLHSDAVKSDGSYSNVNIAMQWGLINDSINTNEAATKGFLAEILVKCVGLKDTSGMSSDDILEYAVNNNYVSFEYRGRTDSIRNVSFEDVTNSISNSFSIWTNRIIETKEEIVLGDDVVNLMPEITSPAEITINELSKEIVIPAYLSDKVVIGKAFIVPDPITGEAKAFQAESTEIQGDQVVITATGASIDTTIQNLKFSGNAKVDFNNTPVTDGVGNVINSGAISNMVYNNNSIVNYSNAVYRSYSANTAEQLNIVPCASMQLGFTVDGISVTGKISDNDISFSLKGDIKISDDLKVSLNKSYSVKDLSFDYDWNIEWFQLKYAYAKLNYTTVDTTGVSLAWSKEGAGFADQRGNHGKDDNKTSWWKPTLKDIFTSDVRTAAAAKGAKTITICSFPIVNGGIGRIDIDIKAKISITGTVELVITTHNTNGLEYKNGNIRYIKENKQDTDLNVKAKIEGTLYAGVSIKAIGINLVGVGIEFGLGVEFKATAHLVNSDNVEIEKMSLDGSGEIAELSIASLQNVTYEEDGKKLSVHVDICGDITTYKILRFKFDDDCALSKILAGKSDKSGGTFKLEIEIFGSSNAKIDELCTHIEDWHFIKECTRKYGNTDESTESSSEDSNEFQSGDKLDLDTYYLNLLVGNTAIVSVTQMPKGYSNSSVKYESKNQSVATVDSTGKIVAVGEGSTEIVAYIPGTDFKISCSITVSAKSEENQQSITKTKMV